MVRLLLGSVVAAVVMFGWGAYYWMVLADQAGLIQPLPEEKVGDTDIVDALNAALDESGVYFYPVRQPEEDEEAFTERHREGPLMMLHFTAGGIEPMSWRTMAAGYVHMLAACFLLGMILRFAAKPSWSYMTKAGFCLVVGVFASVLIDPQLVIWYSHHVKFHHYNGVYHVGAVLFAGLVLSAFIKPTSAAAR